MSGGASRPFPRVGPFPFAPVFPVAFPFASGARTDGRPLVQITTARFVGRLASLDDVPLQQRRGHRNGWSRVPPAPPLRRPGGERAAAFEYRPSLTQEPTAGGRLAGCRSTTPDSLAQIPAPLPLKALYATARLQYGGGVRVTVSAANALVARVLRPTAPRFFFWGGSSATAHPFLGVEGGCTVTAARRANTAAAFRRTSSSGTFWVFLGC